MTLGEDLRWAQEQIEILLPWTAKHVRLMYIAAPLPDPQESTWN